MKNYLTFIFSVFVLSSFGQTNSIQNYIGFQARLIDLMPFEFSFIHDNNSGVSYTLRAGYGKGEKNSFGTATNFNKNNMYYIGNFNNLSSNFTFNQSYSALFFKTGIVFSKIKKVNYTFYNIVNYSYVNCNDKIIINNNDQLYGSVINEYTEKNTYQALEYEGNFQFKLTPQICYGIGYIFGAKINPKIPFRNILPGIENGSTYTPAQGVGQNVYLNFSLSLMYKL